MTEFPASYLPVEGSGIDQDRVFDPALRQYQNAFRPGEPRFDDLETGLRWRAARRAALEQVVRTVAASPWRDRLMLRGSMLLKAWYGQTAREPGDLDFVVTPKDWMLEDAETARMFAGIARAAEHGEVRIDAAAAVSDDIWTYERVPGRRLVLPWHADGLPSGSVQLDFTFNETLPIPPEPTVVAGAELPAATRELSLAWKLQWLLADRYPQGKDLYDAVLLSRHAMVSHLMLKQLAASADAFYARNELTLDAFSLDEIDWRDFHLPVDKNALIGSARTTIEMILAEPLPELPTEYERRALWHAPTIEDCRSIFARTDEQEVFRWLMSRDIGFGDQTLIAAEAMDLPLREIAARLLTYAQTINDYYTRSASVLLAEVEELAER